MSSSFFPSPFPSSFLSISFFFFPHFLSPKLFLPSHSPSSPPPTTITRHLILPYFSSSSSSYIPSLSPSSSSPSFFLLYILFSPPFPTSPISPPSSSPFFFYSPLSPSFSSSSYFPSLFPSFLLLLLLLPSYSFSTSLLLLFFPAFSFSFFILIPLLPLPTYAESAAESLVVIVVWRRVESVAPGGGSGGRLDEAPVALTAAGPLRVEKDVGGQCER